MRAYVLDENQVVINTVLVGSLNDFSNLISAENGGDIGDVWDGTSFKKPIKIIPPKEHEFKAMIESRAKALEKSGNPLAAINLRRKHDV